MLTCPRWHMLKGLMDKEPPQCRAGGASTRTKPPSTSSRTARSRKDSRGSRGKRCGETGKGKGGFKTRDLFADERCSQATSRRRGGRQDEELGADVEERMEPTFPGHHRRGVECRGTVSCPFVFGTGQGGERGSHKEPPADWSRPGQNVRHHSLRGLNASMINQRSSERCTHDIYLSCGSAMPRYGRPRMAPTGRHLCDPAWPSIPPKHARGVEPPSRRLRLLRGLCVLVARYNSTALRAPARPDNGR